MSESYGWVQRQRRGKVHLAESIVAGDVVTRCGRRLTDEPTKTGGRLVTEKDRAFLIDEAVCKVCDR